MIGDTDDLRGIGWWKRLNMTHEEKEELIEKCNKLKVKERDERDEMFNFAIEECIELIGEEDETTTNLYKW